MELLCSAMAVRTGSPPSERDTFDRFFDRDDFPASVTITRTSQADFQTRQLVVSIDGRRVGTLLWGDTITRHPEPGPHTLRVHNTLVWKTVPFTLAPGEQVFFEAVNRPGRGTLVMTVLFGIGPLYVTVNRM
jgi:hypothetical protein